MKNRILFILAVVLCISLISGCKKAETVKTQASDIEISDTEISEEVSAPDESEEAVQPSEESSSPPVPKKASAEDLAKIQDYDSKYFVKKLTAEEKYRFVELYEAVSEFRESVAFYTPPTDEELTKLMILLNYDCPELIQINGDYFPEYGPDDTVTLVKFSYILDKNEYSSAVKKLSTVLQIIKEKTEGKTDYEKEKIVYDRIFRETEYIEDDKNAGSIYGTLCLHKGRCEGFSKSFEWLTRKIGFECITLMGHQSWSTQALFASHSWNTIKIGDNWYNVDITCDNTQKAGVMTNPPNYGFFNVSDDKIMALRDIEKPLIGLGVPVCKNEDLDYHIMNGLYFKKGEGTPENLKKMLKTHDTDQGIQELTVKYESEDEYKKALEYSRNVVDSYSVNESGKGFKYLIYRSDLSKTLIIDVMRNTDNVSGG